MNPLVELWVASGLGAALFFAAGYSLCLVLRRTEQVVTESRLAHLRAEIEHVQLAYAAQGHEVDHLDHRAMRAEQSAAELSDALSQARAECLRLDKELRRHSHSTERASALERENAHLIAQVRARALSSTEAEVTELREKLERAEARARELSAELREQKSMDRSPAVQRQLAELRQRIAETAKARAHWESRARAMETTSVSQGAVEAANSALTLELQRLERTARERAARIRVLSERIHELEHSARENASLQRQRDTLTFEQQRLQEDRSGASEAPSALSAPPASGFILPAANEREVKHSGIAPRMWSEDETLGAMLSHQVSLLAAEEPGATAVLSDEQGFPLVGTGSNEDQEAVSALTALSQELAGRARALVGLGRVELMEMVDSGGRALRVRFFDWDGQPLALGYLGRPHLVQSEGEARMVSTFPSRRAARSA
jgi:hypothetical protein